MAKTKSQTTAGDYAQIINPQGYINNQEITNLPEFYLVKGSQNMIIKNAQKAMTRKGYILKGAAKTQNHGIHSFFDWSTSSNEILNLRAWYKTLEVWFNDAWTTVTAAMSGSKMRFTTWWDADELLDILLIVDGTSKVRSWSGGVTKVASVTANTIVKQGYVTGTDVNLSNNGAAPSTIIKTGGGFANAAFAPGDTIVVQGSVSNDGTYTITSASDTVLVLDPSFSLTSESAGNSVVVKLPVGTFDEARFFTIDGGVSNNRQVDIDGITYTYTGENGGTLTGVTPDPTLQSSVPQKGDTIMQTIRVYTPTGLIGFEADKISTQNNYVFYGSSVSREVLIAGTLDFTDFTFTTPLRKPGEGFTISLDSCPTAFAPAADQQTINKTGLVTIFAGRDDEYQVTFTLSTDQQSETIDILKQKTGTGMAAQSPEVIATIRNAILFLTFEPTIEMLGKQPLGIDSSKSTPISDLIRDDIEAYDLTNASMRYHQRDLHIALPKEGKWLIFDFQNNYWQPPQIAPFSGFSVFPDGTLIAHNAYLNESYELNQGYNDNGNPIAFAAAYGYDNYGARFNLKGFDQHATELYISKNTKVTKTINYEYKGSQAQRSFIIDGSKTKVNFLPRETVSLGSQKLGQKPIGSSDRPLSETTDGYIGMGKMRLVQTTQRLDFFERQIIFSSNAIDDRWMIIAFGENVEMSDNIPSFIFDP